MAWTAPMTAVAGAAFTAAQFNANVRDNLNETAPAKATTASRLIVTTGLNTVEERAIFTNVVGTSETTTSTTFADLATSGPAVTATTGTYALAFVTAMLTNNTAAWRSEVHYEVTGASSVAPNSNFALISEPAVAARQVRATALTHQSGLTSGSNTFTMKYRVSGNTGTFAFRCITVIPL